MNPVGEPLVRVDRVSKRFCRRSDRMLRYGLQDLCRDLLARPPRDELREGEFWGLRDIDLTIRRGDVIGLVGHNGAGKSSLLRLVSGIYRPTLGSITVHTAKVAVLDHGAGLDPMQTGRESIVTKLALLGHGPEQARGRVDEIIAMAELRDVIDAAVCTYSTGMRVRLAFAIYASVDIDLFIVDDSLGVADIRFAQRMQRYWQDFVAAGGTMLLASHEMYQLRSLCSRVLQFDHGRIVDDGETEAVIARYLLRSTGSAVVAERAQAPSAPNPVPVAGVPGEATPSEPGTMERYMRFADAGVFPVCITAIELESDPDVGGAAAQVLGQLTVRVHCESTIAAERVCLGFEIFDASKRVVIHVQGPDAAPHYCIRPGRNTFSATLLHVPLMPGRYSIGAALVDSESRAILGMRGWEDSGAPLDVLPSYGNDFLGAISRSAMMTAPVRWSTGAAIGTEGSARGAAHDQSACALAQRE